LEISFEASLAGYLAPLPLTSGAGKTGQQASPKVLKTRPESAAIALPVIARWDNGHEDNSPENGSCRTLLAGKPPAGVKNGKSTGA
jgi:hypothetical protein